MPNERVNTAPMPHMARRLHQGQELFITARPSEPLHDATTQQHDHQDQSRRRYCGQGLGCRARREVPDTLWTVLLTVPMTNATNLDQVTSDPAGAANPTSGDGQ